MKPKKILKIAFNMVKANKLRSWLTIIGVIIGIASVMAIVTTGEYFQEQVTETLEGLGGDTITIVASIPFQVNEEGEMVKDTEVSSEVAAETSRKTEEVTAETEEVTAETEEVSETNTSDSIEPESVTEAELTKMDVFTLLSIPDVEYINVNVEDGAELTFGSETTSVGVKGVDPNFWPKFTNKKVEQGQDVEIRRQISRNYFKRTFE